MFKWLRAKWSTPASSKSPIEILIDTTDNPIPENLPETLLQRIQQYVQYNYVDYSDVQFSLKKETTPWRLELRGKDLIRIVDDGTAATFSNEVKRIMQEKNLTPSELCSKILMDRRLFSKLNTDVDYRPSKETAIALCFGLQLSYEAARVLLDRAGFTLSNGIKYDVVITYLLKNKIYDIDTINEVLFQFGMKCIGSKL